MEIRLRFEELSKYVSEHYGKSLSFTRLSENELCVSYEQRVFITSIKVPVNIRIDEVRDSLLVLSYSGKFGIDSIIKGVLIFIKSKMPEFSDAIEVYEDSHLAIDLSRLKHTQKLVSAVALKQVLVFDDGFYISVALL